ncbi:MAG TPA: UDP-N-acetylmuramate dehydrogenase [Sphingobacteriaceae bacterium]|nr:UDP-N-acetylmuramate dehydrogenase [Sphingobacteriaceae bacterium]
MELIVTKNQELERFNTFGVKARSAYFVEIRTEEDLIELFEQGSLPDQKLILGGGSNILFVRDFEGLVIRINIPGITHEIRGTEVMVSAGGGVVWNDLVWYCVEHGFAGIENLALIPGTVGAAPVQNIGAYGVELMDVFQHCRAYDTLKKEMVVLNHKDCVFTYRDSIFKNKAKGRYIITSITLKLSTEFTPVTGYGAIGEELAIRGISSPEIRDMAEVVSAIRVSKLPDPSTIGNAGSFFKNPVISTSQFLPLKSKFPNIVHYTAGEGWVKIAAGWLIEQCGWKGKRVGNCGTWKNQALVLVNHSDASGSDIYNLSEHIIKDVKQKFGIILEREVNVV